MPKTYYPIVLSPSKEGGYAVDVPDLQIGTQGDTIAECMEMARDAIGLWCICEQDENRPIPEPSTTEPNHDEGEIVTLVDIDIDAYRRSIDNRSVRRNVSLPSWLDYAAREAGVNVSAILVNALKSELHLENT